jgi:Icc-related predicted phosphoesterase
MSMRAWILSDIHLELSSWDLPAPESRSEFDVLIVAGDLITRAERGVRWLQERVPDKPALYVLGNHESFGEDIDRTLEKARDAAAGSLVHVMENDVVTIGDVEFLGGTMWTDYALLGRDRVRQCMDFAQYSMNDHRRIRQNDYAHRFMPADALARHERTVAFFRARAREAPGVRRVIITHHSPDPTAADNDLLSAAYCSDLEPLMSELNCAAWISGHVHKSNDRFCGATRVVSNPKGYGPVASEPPNAWQNPRFDPGLTIELGS